MFKQLFITGVAVVSLTACSSAVKNYSQPQNLLFQNKDINTKTISVERDEKLCGDDTLEQQNCATSFYIDDFKAGDFYINNQAQYELKDDQYTLKVKNCTTECAVHEIQYNLNDAQKNRKLILSIDQNGLPFIIQTGLNQDQSAVEQLAPPTKPAQEINLAADALFIFDRYTLEDILPENMSKLEQFAKQALADNVKIDRIEVIGHTDRLGSQEYNMQLAQRRADTVRNYLVSQGLEKKLMNVIITSSMGKNQPVTDGCLGVQPRDVLHACLQNDRRVEVVVKGVQLVD